MDVLHENQSLTLHDFDAGHPCPLPFGHVVSNLIVLSDCVSTSICCKAPLLFQSGLDQSSWHA
jgi:hypothetical protein